MKFYLHKTMSFAMALVVLFSTLSFTMNMHYCGDTLVETALFNKAEGCGMKMEKPVTKECSITKKSCCSDEQLVVDGQNELKLNLDQVSFDQHFFIASFVYTYINLFEGVKNNTVSFETYQPPLVRTQIFKLDETYLI